MADRPAMPRVEALTVGELLDLLAVEDPAPAASTAAALAAAMGAALVEMAARASEGWPDAPGIAAQAAARRVRCTKLAAAGAEALADAREALDRRDGLEEPLNRTVDLLLAVADAASDVAELGAHTAERSDWPFRPDAASAALLAEAAVAIAGLLVRANLTILPGDVRLEGLEHAEAGAGVAARRAMESV